MKISEVSTREKIKISFEDITHTHTHSLAVTCIESDFGEVEIFFGFNGTLNTHCLKTERRKTVEKIFGWEELQV